MSFFLCLNLPCSTTVPENIDGVICDKYILKYVGINKV